MSNKKVLTRIRTTKKLLLTTRKIQLKFLGHTMKKEGLLKIREAKEVTASNLLD